MGERTGDAIRELIHRRGDERVSFADVADHLEDYRDRRPDRAEVIEDLARFLARVEAVPHDHGGPAGSSIDEPAG